MHRIRLSVRENRLSRPDIVTEADYEPFVATSGTSFVAEDDEGPIGFAMLDIGRAHVWALFVSPHSEGLGAGRALHDALLAAAAAKGIERLWLTTAPGTRAAEFYARLGWTACGVTASGELRFERAPRATPLFAARGRSMAAHRPAGAAMSEPTLYYIPYERFLDEVEALAQRIAADGWDPTFLVGIGRGGLVPGAYLSHRTGLPLLSVDHSSGEHGFGDELLDKLAAKIRDGARILIVDDINDSGGTINYLRSAIEAKTGGPEGLRVAVLIHNTRSDARAEYRGSEIDRDVDKSWYVFPWEALAPRETLKEEALEVPERLA